MNVQKLQEALNHMVSVPERCDMNVVMVANLTPNDKYSYINAVEDHTVPRCGTVGCIAGWTAELNGFEAGVNSYNPAADRMGFARDVLELTQEQADRLFTEPRYAGSFHHANAWPIDLAKEYVEATTIREQANVIYRRGQRFIATDGAE